MNRRAELEGGVLQTVLIAFLVVGVVGFLFFGFVEGLGAGYGVSVTESDLNQSAFNKYDEMFTTVGEIQDDMTNITGTTDALLSVTEASYNVGTLVLSDVPSAATDVFSYVGHSLGLPKEVVSLAFAVILIIIIFGVINLIIKVFA
jgi:hypothetical protein